MEETAVACGQLVDVGLQAIQLPTFHRADELEFRFRVDPDDQIVELNEYNNTLLKTVNIRQLAIPWDRFDYAEDGSVLLEGRNTQDALERWCVARSSGEIGGNAFHYQRKLCTHDAAYDPEESVDLYFDVSRCDRIGEVQCIRGENGVRTTECRLVEGVGRRELTTCERGARAVCDESGEVVGCE